MNGKTAEGKIITPKGSSRKRLKMKNNNAAGEPL
jgi:hypothetical protein